MDTDQTGSSASRQQRAAFANVTTDSEPFPSAFLNNTSKQRPRAKERAFVECVYLIKNKRTALTRTAIFITGL